MSSQPLEGVSRTRRLTGPLEQTRGVIGREPGPDEAYVFDFDERAERPVHMIGVRSPLRVQWCCHGVVCHEEILEPWTGYARHRCDRIIERGVVEDG